MVFTYFSPFFFMCMLMLFPPSPAFVVSSEITLFLTEEKTQFSQSTGCAWLCYTQAKKKMRNKGREVHYFSD